MPRRYAAFLRGINLGKRRVSGAELAKAVDAAEGISGATPFIASGNVVFEDRTRRGPAAIAAAIEAAIEAAFGWESTALLRDADEIAAIAALEPFSDRQLEASDGKPQVILLGREPTDAEREEIAGMVPEGDLIVPGERELHWLPSAGLADNELDLKALDRLLGTTTVRTANTIRRLHVKFFQ